MQTSAIYAQARMQKFDAEFKNLDHYIRVITDRIWEGRQIEDIRKYYSDPCVVETPSSVSTSVQSVIDGTHATLAMFPDRRLLAEDVIQSGDDQGGFLSSHRIISPMTHLGDGSFGAATGNRLQVRTIADCVCKDNLITHEWLVRDQGAIAVQIGSTPQALAQRWLYERGGWNKPMASPAPAYYASHISTDPLAVRYAQALQDFVDGKSKVELVYDDAVHHIGPCGVTRFGHAEVLMYWRGLFQSLRPSSLQIEHLAVQRGDGRADRVAVRWRAQCELVSTGFSSVKEASQNKDKPLHSGQKIIELMGINHVEFNRGRVLREWVLIDEVALWMQILAEDKK